MTPLRIGITGASGFIGRTLAARLLAAGHRVVGLDLAGPRPDLPAAPGLELLFGDAGDPRVLARFCAGLDRVYHTAALVKERGALDAFRRVNVECAVAVARAARAAAVRELVHFSSVMVYGFDFPEDVAEDGPLDGAGNPYCVTKIEAERALAPLSEPGRFDVYLIRPGDVYGPGSVPWTIRPVEMMRRRQWLFVDSRRSVFNHVYVDNLLDGIDVVLEARASGRPFNITDGARTSVRDFFSFYLDALGIGWVPEAPAFAVLPAAELFERLSERLGRDPQISRDAVRYLTRAHRYGDGAVRALGYRPRVELAEGMARTRAWLAEAGYLDRAARRASSASSVGERGAPRSRHSETTSAL